MHIYVYIYIQLCYVLTVRRDACNAKKEHPAINHHLLWLLLFLKASHCASGASNAGSA